MAQESREKTIRKLSKKLRTRLEELSNEYISNGKKLVAAVYHEVAPDDLRYPYGFDDSEEHRAKLLKLKKGELVDRLVANEKQEAATLALLKALVLNITPNLGAVPPEYPHHTAWKENIPKGFVTPSGAVQLMINEELNDGKTPVYSNAFHALTEMTAPDNKHHGPPDYTKTLFEPINDIGYLESRLKVHEERLASWNLLGKK